MSVPGSSLPSTVIDNELYLGSFSDAKNRQTFNSLKIGCVINCTWELPNHFEKEGNVKYLRLELIDVTHCDATPHFDKVYEFITNFFNSQPQRNAVLFHCAHGISRSTTMTIAYLMRKNMWDVKTAYYYLKAIRDIIQPNEGFVECLLKYEKILFPDRSEPSIDISQYHKIFNN